MARIAVNGVNLDPRALQFGDVVRASFVELASNNTISSWRSFSNGSRDYNANFLSADGVKLVVNYNAKVCEFWHRNGFDKFWVMN